MKKDRQSGVFEVTEPESIDLFILKSRPNSTLASSWFLAPELQDLVRL